MHNIYRKVNEKFVIFIAIWIRMSQNLILVRLNLISQIVIEILSFKITLSSEEKWKIGEQPSKSDLDQRNVQFSHYNLCRVLKEMRSNIINIYIYISEKLWRF